VKMCWNELYATLLGEWKMLKQEY